MDPYSYSMGYSTGYQGGHITATHNKKIQNYVFNMNDVLGKGNFSKVYRAVNELTSTPAAYHRLGRGDQSGRAVQHQDAGPGAAALLRNRYSKDAQTS